MQRFDKYTKLELTLNVESINIGDYVIQKAEPKACTDVQIISFFFFLLWHFTPRVITMTLDIVLLLVLHPPAKIAYCMKDAVCVHVSI